MTTNNHLFETELTDGSRFRKFKPIYLLLLFVFFGIHVVYTIVTEGKENELTNILFTPFVIITVLVFIAAIGISFYMKSKVGKGSIKIFEEKVEIHKGEIFSYKLNEIEKLEIQRGATYHYDHQIGNEIVKIGNYIRFISNDESIEFEFLIDSKKKNEAFESMILTLQKKGVRIYYTSV